MTAALEGGEWSAAWPGRILPPRKSRYPFYRRLGGPQGRSGRAENLVPTGIRSRTFQPIVSRYTDWATRPTIDAGAVSKSDVSMKNISAFTKKMYWNEMWEYCLYSRLRSKLFFGLSPYPKKSTVPLKYKEHTWDISIKFPLFFVTLQCESKCIDRFN